MAAVESFIVCSSPRASHLWHARHSRQPTQDSLCPTASTCATTTTASSSKYSTQPGPPCVDPATRIHHRKLLSLALAQPRNILCIVVDTLVTLTLPCNFFRASQGPNPRSHHWCCLFPPHPDRLLPPTSSCSAFAGSSRCCVAGSLLIYAHEDRSCWNWLNPSCSGKARPVLYTAHINSILNLHFTTPLTESAAGPPPRYSASGHIRAAAY